MSHLKVLPAICHIIYSDSLDSYRIMKSV